MKKLIIYKTNMRYLRLIQTLFRNRIFIEKQFSTITTFSVQTFKEHNLEKRKSVGSERVLGRLVYTEIDNDMDELEEVDVDTFEADTVKKLLFPQTTDTLLLGLSNCASIEETLVYFKSNQRFFNVEHLTQTVMVLRDIQVISRRYNEEDNKAFAEKLLKNDKFVDFLAILDHNLNGFDQKLLSYLLLYLNKLGVNIKQELMQKFSMKLCDLLKEHFCISNCSRLFNAIFNENSVRPYFISLDLIPKVTSYIEECQTPEQLADLSTCLTRIAKTISLDTLEKYECKLRFFLKNKKISTKDHETILKVILFLNYPSWRDRNVGLSSQCMLLLKDEITSLKVDTFLKIYGVLYKNQEPGELLNSIQRCSAKFLQQIEEGELVDNETHLKLFASLIYFSSPIHRTQFQKDVQKLFKKFNKHNSNLSILDLLRRVFSFVKVSDKELCKQYWDLTMDWFDENADDTQPQTIIQMCQNYLHFSTDLDNYRYHAFENKMLSLIDEISQDEIIFPSLLIGLLNFYIVYGRNERIMLRLLDKFENNITQFRPLHCLRLSDCFTTNFPNPNFPNYHVNRLREALNKLTEQIAGFGNIPFNKNGILLKAAIVRNDFENTIIDDLFFKYKEVEFMSSKLLENICYVFFNTGTLIPEVINKCTEYVVNNPRYITGFNAEKLLFLCYYLAYYPINAEKFFQVSTDIIIRDQERLSGLSILHSAMSLAYFSNLPGSFIKQIFNVEFMDKLDAELANCYSKEKYPQRVRNCLMQLNRAVCLEYPEYNVPWFHKKYVEEMRSRYVMESDNHFQIRFKAYLRRIIGGRDKILENVVTPYGYLIDFVVNFDQNDNIVSDGSAGIKRRLALLLIRPQGFTRFYTHLKGKNQLAKRHLEMFGYEVSTVIFSEWINLLYADERIDYVKNLLWPKKIEDSDSLRRR